MNRILFFAPAAATCIAIFFGGVPLNAQTPGASVPIEANPAKTPSLTLHAVPPPENAPTLKLQLSSVPLNVAVDDLQRALRAEQLPELNVLYGPSVKELPIPDLTLRNVTGTDALRLIAASANCDIEMIKGETGRIIGYRIVPLQAMAGADWKSGFGGGAQSLNAYAYKRDQISGDNVVPTERMSRSAPKSLTASPVPGTAISKTSRDLTIGPKVSADVVRFTSPAAPPSMVCVYSLGGITAATPYADIEETLRELFKLEEISSDAVELSVHKRTNVLAVKGDGRVHELVSQLLEAMQKNIAATATRSVLDAHAQREILARIAADAEKQQKEKAAEQVQKAEAKVAEAERELEKRKLSEPKGR